MAVCLNQIYLSVEIRSPKHMIDYRRRKYEYEYEYEEKHLSSFFPFLFSSPLPLDDVNSSQDWIGLDWIRSAI